MKHVFTATALAILLVQGVQAGSIQSLSSSGRLIESAGCSNAECFESVQVKTKLKTKGSLVPAEVAGFNRNTVVEIEMPLEEVNFRLGDDPEFTDGDTSVNYTTSPLAGSNITFSVKMSWGGGKLKAVSSIKGELKQISPHLSDTKSLLDFGKQFKNHSSPRVPFTLQARNPDEPPFLQMEAVMFVDARIEQNSEAKFDTDQVIEEETIRYKSRTFGPPLEK